MENGESGFSPEETMLRKALICFILFSAAIFSFGYPQIEARKELSGRVIIVYDGDTVGIRFDGGETRKVRLLGIDTPEMSDSRPEVRFLAFSAKRFAFHHLYKKRVTLTFDEVREDRYGRLLAYIWMEEGILFNLLILEKGYADLYYSADCREKKKFAAALSEARIAERGLWRRPPYPVIDAARADEYIGEMVTVRFCCGKIRQSGRILLLSDRLTEFEAGISGIQMPDRNERKKHEGENLEVTGYMEEYRGHPQIIVSGAENILDEKGRPLFHLE